MKKYLPLIVAMAAGCQTENPGTEEVQVLDKQVNTMKLGTEEVYSVSFKATADKDMYQLMSIELARDEDVWLDTIALELSAGDTLDTEIIFSDAKAANGSEPELKIYPVASK